MHATNVAAPAASAAVGAAAHTSLDWLDPMTLQRIITIDATCPTCGAQLREVQNGSETAPSAPVDWSTVGRFCHKGCLMTTYDGPQGA